MKSSFCNSGKCVDVTPGPDGTVLVSDTKTPGVALTFTFAEWEAFLAGVRAGEFTFEALGQG